MKPIKLAGAMVLVILAGCGSSSDSPPGTTAVVDMPHFNDVVTAPATIQKAAKAVVRIHTARSTATGSFISATGLLLTNNHVLGIAVCPVEGCYVDISFFQQRGEQYLAPVTVFAKPQAVDVGLDMAVVQLYNGPGGSKLNTPDYLSFQSMDSTSLIGTHVTIVGHPEGHLKKWSDGVVFDTDGSWFISSAYILPGDSGSPVLNDNGKIVGLIHRGPTAQDLFTDEGANVYSIGTASAPVMAAMNTPLPATMISTAAATTSTRFVANDLAYLNAHAATIHADGADVSALKLLGQACDASLARQDFLSPDDLKNALTPCYHAQTWIDCRVDGGSVPYGVVCPAGSEATDWANRFQKMNQLWVAMNGQTDTYSVSFAIARLQPTMAAGYASGAQSLQNALSNTRPVLDYSTADYLAAFNVPSYNGMNIKDYVVNYKNSLEYAQQSSDIVSAGGGLFGFGSLSKNDFAGLLAKLYGDPKMSVGTRLYIEDIQHMMGVLPAQ